jgi:hypothetical protein
VHTYHAPAAARNSTPQTEQDLRAELNALAARYDSGAVSPATLGRLPPIESDAP